MRTRKGFTIMETVIVITVTAIIASAFVTVVVPMMNTFFYFPQSSRVNSAASDLIDIIAAGDFKAKGLRYAGPPCTPVPWVTATAYMVGNYVRQNGIAYYCLVNHTSGVFATDLASGDWTSSAITTASTSGSTSTLTYHYSSSDYCVGGSSAPGTSHTVTLVYDSSLGTVTRAIDGGAAQNIPDYVGSSSDINFSVSGGGTDLFHYYDNTPTDLGSAPTLSSISRVDIDVIASSGAGTVKSNSGQIRLKAGIDIKQYTT